MIKKFLSPLLALALLCGCASTRNREPETIVEEKPIERTSVTLFTDDRSGYFASVAEELRASDDSLAPAVQVAGADAAGELRALLLSGAAPELIYLSPENDRGIYAALREDGALYALDPLLGDDPLSSFAVEKELNAYAGILDAPEARSEDGKLVGLPMTYEAAGLLAKAGAFETEKPPKTFADLLAMDEGREEKLLGFPQEYPASLEPFALPFFAVGGKRTRMSAADFAAEDFATGEKPGALAESAGALAELVPAVYTAEPQATLSQVYTAFAGGEILFIPGDRSVAELLTKEYALEEPPALCAVPTGEGPYLLAAPTSFAYVPAAARNPRLGLKLLSMACDSARFEEMAGKLGFLPPLKGSASYLEGYSGQAARLLEEGATAYCGSFAAGKGEEALFEQFYRTLGELLAGKLSAGEWADGMAEFLKEPAKDTADSSSANAA